MKTIEEAAVFYAANELYVPPCNSIGAAVGDIAVLAYTEGFIAAQRFIPIEEEEMPIEEDILVKTERGSIYFGKWYGGKYFCPDLCPEDEFVSIKYLASWRPIFYK